MNYQLQNDDLEHRPPPVRPQPLRPPQVRSGPPGPRRQPNYRNVSNPSSARISKDLCELICQVIFIFVVQLSDEGFETKSK